MDAAASCDPPRRAAARNRLTPAGAVTGLVDIDCKVKSAARRSEAAWTVPACESPRRWVIETTSAEGDARLEYQIEPTDRGCRFMRLLWLRSQRAPWRWFDRNLTRRIRARQSRRAPRRLQRLRGAA